MIFVIAKKIKKPSAAADGFFVVPPVLARKRNM
jgi:hypothetical protein